MGPDSAAPVTTVAGSPGQSDRRHGNRTPALFSLLYSGMGTGQMLIGDGMDRFQWSFQIAADGSLVNGEPFQRLEMPEEGLFSGVGGLTVDSLGYMWAASAMGIQVCEQPGRCSNILNTPEFTTSPVTSLAFGGPGRAWLYVTQGGKLFRRETRRTGVVAWEPVKPPQPGL